jgi:hypothetical protein
LFLLNANSFAVIRLGFELGHETHNATPATLLRLEGAFPATLGMVTSLEDMRSFF